MTSRSACILALCVALLAGCARPPATGPQLSAFAPATQADAASTALAIATATTPAAATPELAKQPGPFLSPRRGELAGRTLIIDSQADVVLRPGEVVLTFDDGPRPGRTEPILEILDGFGVDAVFLMVGEAARAHPELARAVARAGHAIGSHTEGHANLSLLPPNEARAQIWSGHEAVAAALAPLRQQPSRFFRFPYLAQSQLLRTNVNSSNMIILDVDVDSGDWFPETSQQVLARTLERLDARGQGIILFHDIHARTVEMLPVFLAALQDRGYSVVSLRSRGTDVFETEIVAGGEISDLNQASAPTP